MVAKPPRAAVQRVDVESPMLRHYQQPPPALPVEEPSPAVAPAVVAFQRLQLGSREVREYRM